MAASIAESLVPVDSLEALVLVDNVTDSLSSIAAGVANEHEVLRHYGMKLLSGRAKCCAHHGLSLLLAARRGDRVRYLLFDAGPEDSTFERNARRLGVPFSGIEAVVLSHGHWDHAGGMLQAIRMIRGERDAVECHVNDAMFVERANTQADGSVLPYEPVPTPDELRAAGARVVSDADERTLLDGCFYVSGEIPRITEYERGYPGHLRRSAAGAGWEPDPWLMDERYLAANVRGLGLVVFSACSHAGIVNVLREARRAFPDVPLHAVMGGLHLSGARIEPVIGATVADLAGFGLSRIVPAHCSGWRAVQALVQAFGEPTVQPSAVGRQFRFTLS